SEVLEHQNIAGRQRGRRCGSRRPDAVSCRPYGHPEESLQLPRERTGTQPLVANAARTTDVSCQKDACASLAERQDRRQRLLDSITRRIHAAAISVEVDPQ